MAYYRFLACEVLFREACYECAISPNIIDLSFNRFGLHDIGKEKMLAELQSQIDGIAGHSYDAILLGYGLCSNGIAGLSARDIPVVVPRAHDCITILLGSRARYDAEIAGEPGTKYDSPGWIEHHHPESGEDHVFKKLGLDMSCDEMLARYGEENARFLQEAMKGLNNEKHYCRRVYINTGLGPIDELVGRSRAQAEKDGWAFEIVTGDRALIRKMVSGEWDEKDFVVLKPGRVLKPTYNEMIITGN